MVYSFNRAWVWLPAALFAALIVGAYVVADTGQSRLWRSTQEAQAVQSRLRSIGAVLRIVTDAETSERGFLLSGDTGYLDSFREAGQQLPAALDVVRERYPDEREWVVMVEDLATRKMAEMRGTVETRQGAGRAAALDVFRANLDRTTMKDLRRMVRDRQQAEGRRLRAISDQSRRDLSLTRGIIIGDTLLNLSLMLIAAIVVARAMARRTAASRALQMHRDELEREVAARTAELSELSSHLQVVAEREKGALARDLHDELGGLLVAAKIDVVAMRRAAAGDDDMLSRCDRVLAALDAGVDLKRRLVEELRPTLLDNMGLYAALRWQFAETCEQAGLRLECDLPADDLPLTRDAAIALFRVAQEALTNVLRHARAASVRLHVSVTSDELLMKIRDDGIGVPAGAPGARGHGWSGMRHRVGAFGGTCRLRSPAGRYGTEVEVRLPLARILEPGTREARPFDSAAGRIGPAHAGATGDGAGLSHGVSR